MIGQDKYFKWDYSEKSDILHVHKQKKKVEGSAELGDFTFDFDKNGNVVGVEIINVSQFLQQMDIPKDQLNQIQCAEILIDRRNPAMTLVWVKLRLPNRIERRIPIPAPIVASVAA